MRDDIRRHLADADPILARILPKVDIPDLQVSKSFFTDLCSIVINQQLSEKAGNTIFSRFASLFPNKIITPDYTSTLSVEQIRACGVSGAKTKSLLGLATAALAGKIPFEQFASMSNNDVQAFLITLPGIGPWSAEMFLMFSLGREDLFSVGDVGLKNAIKRLYGYKKDPSPATLVRISKRWAPYRTYACRVLWKSLELDVT